MIVTNDHSPYLTTPSIAASSSSRSDTLYVDWSLASPLKNSINDNTQEQLQSYHKELKKDTGSLFLIESVLKHTIFLQNPYNGPPVVNGQPRVYLRTNLIPKCGQASSCGISSATTRATYDDQGTGPKDSVTAVTNLKSKTVLLKKQKDVRLVTTLERTRSDCTITSSSSSSSVLNSNSTYQSNINNNNNIHNNNNNYNNNIHNYNNNDSINIHNNDDNNSGDDDDDVPITVLCCHPFLHYIIAGLKNDTIIILE